jgi:hypothetical protein
MGKRTKRKLEGGGGGVTDGRKEKAVGRQRKTEEEGRIIQIERKNEEERGREWKREEEMGRRKETEEDRGRERRRGEERVRGKEIGRERKREVER